MEDDYIFLGENELGLVSSQDHLTIMGHSCGQRIQEDTSDQLAKRLVKLGLKKAPRVLSLDCCDAGVENGVAQQLSILHFFENTIIEACVSNTVTSFHPEESDLPTTKNALGRGVISDDEYPWIYFMAGTVVNRRAQTRETFSEIISQLEDILNEKAAVSVPDEKSVPENALSENIKNMPTSRKSKLRKEVAEQEFIRLLFPNYPRMHFLIDNETRGIYKAVSGPSSPHRYFSNFRGRITLAKVWFDLAAVDRNTHLDLELNHRVLRVLLLSNDLIKAFCKSYLDGIAKEADELSQQIINKRDRLLREVIRNEEFFIYLSSDQAKEQFLAYINYLILFTPSKKEHVLFRSDITKPIEEQRFEKLQNCVSKWSVSNVDADIKDLILQLGSPENTGPICEMVANFFEAEEEEPDAKSDNNDTDIKMNDKISDFFLNLLRKLNIQSTNEAQTSLEPFLSLVEIFISKSKSKELVDRSAILYNLNDYLENIDYLEHNPDKLFFVKIAFCKTMIVKIAKTLEEEEKGEFLRNLVKISIEKSHFSFLIFLINTFRLDINTLALDDNLLSRAHGFLSTDPDKQERLMQTEQAFMHGLVNITYDQGLLSLTETSTRKQYPFTPTILNKENGEVGQYLEMFKNIKPPVRERFVVAATHWICGEIKVDPSGEMSCVLIDSAGSTPYLTDVALEINKRFPECKIYVTDFIRQHSPYGCTVFALDDLRHLHTIEKYLSPKYKKIGLFGYLEDSHQKEGPIEIQNDKETLEVRKCKLPLPFMRPFQSSKLWLEVIPEMIAKEEWEQEQPVNKKQENISIASEKHIIEANGKTKNGRLNYTLYKMGNYAIGFIKKYSNDEIIELSNPFTLNGFITRIQMQHPPKKPKKQSFFGKLCGCGATPPKVENMSKAKVPQRRHPSGEEKSA